MLRIRRLGCWETLIRSLRAEEVLWALNSHMQTGKQRAETKTHRKHILQN